LKRAMEIWRGFWRLSGAERRVVLAAAAGLTATWAGLRLFGFRRWSNLLAQPPSSGPQNPTAPRLEAIDSARAIAQLEAAANRNLFFRTNCLEQSLVLGWLLRRRGMKAEVLIGARKQANRFEAHAWVEVDGMVLNDSGEGHLHFSPFAGPIASMETRTH
jgi:Transglutaminase-like superfamily